MTFYVGLDDERKKLWLSSINLPPKVRKEQLEDTFIHVCVLLNFLFVSDYKNVIDVNSVGRGKVNRAELRQAGDDEGSAALVKLAGRQYSQVFSNILIGSTVKKI